MHNISTPTTTILLTTVWNFCNWFSHLIYTIQTIHVNQKFCLQEAEFVSSRGLCWGHEGDEQDWTVRCLALSDNHLICFNSLEHNLGINIFRLTSLCWLLRFLQSEQNFLNHLVTVLWSTARFTFCTDKYFWLLLEHYEPVQTSKA